MVTLRPALLALALSCGIAGPGFADASLLTTVATCTGRLSAVLEHQWATRDGRSEKTEKLHKHMTELFHVLSTAETDRSAREVRAQSKDAFRALIARAHIHPPDKTARMAATRVFTTVRQCVALILPPDVFTEYSGLTSANDFLADTGRGAELRSADAQILSR